MPAGWRAAYKLVHFFYGLLSGLAFKASPWLCLANTAFFHTYEFIEYFIVRDRVYHDLREFYAGFGLATLLYVLGLV